MNSEKKSQLSIEFRFIWFNGLKIIERGTSKFSVSNIHFSAPFTAPRTVLCSDSITLTHPPKPSPPQGTLWVKVKVK
jgi:hypothetical protein